VDVYKQPVTDHAKVHGTTIKDAAIKKNLAVAYPLLYAACVLLLCCGLNIGLAARASD